MEAGGEGRWEGGPPLRGLPRRSNVAGEALVKLKNLHGDKWLDWRSIIGSN